MRRGRGEGMEGRTILYVVKTTIHGSSRWLRLSKRMISAQLLGHMRRGRARDSRMDPNLDLCPWGKRGNESRR